MASSLGLGGMVIAGMCVSFPVSLGVAKVLNVIWGFAINAQGSAILMLGGAVKVPPVSMAMRNG